MAAEIALTEYLRQEAATAESPRDEALTRLAEHLETAPGGAAARLREPGLLQEAPDLRNLVAAYGKHGPGGETSFVDAASAALREIDFQRFAARPRWSYLNPLTYGVALLREQRVRCPQCAERIRREAQVCRYCGYRLEH